MHEVQKFLLESSPDNTDALNMLILNYETLMSTYGHEEEDLNDHLEVNIARVRYNAAMLRLIQKSMKFQLVEIQFLSLFILPFLWNNRTTR